MSNLNIPPLLEQYRENMLNPSNSITVRHNYMMNLQNIRDFWIDVSISTLSQQDILDHSSINAIPQTLN